MRNIAVWGFALIVAVVTIKVAGSVEFSHLLLWAIIPLWRACAVL